ncbi:MAG: dTDP-4-dehydrorhamnose reductase, partial [Rikenellaceae bacterium]|nr:dTDP-4-dehydrorhamnose reductase [Rikenellaceae bacterium]
MTPPKKNIWITGASGQLGVAWKRLAAGDAEFAYLFTDVEVDIADHDAVERFLANHRVDCIVNGAAYTAVDRAESDLETARRINVRGVENLARAAIGIDATLIQISTDYVFDGQACFPYREEDPPHPESVYGATKLAGEEALQYSRCRGIIVRTSWLYSLDGHNFLTTMLRLGAEREVISVVNDQRGTPTRTGDLAGAIRTIIPQLFEAPLYGGIFHFSNAGNCTWYDFARQIIALSGLPARVEPIATADYPAIAPRPAYSVLDKGKIGRVFGITPRPWEEALAEE